MGDDLRRSVDEWSVNGYDSAHGPLRSRCAAGLVAPGRARVRRAAPAARRSRGGWRGADGARCGGRARDPQDRAPAGDCDAANGRRGAGAARRAVGAAATRRGGADRGVRPAGGVHRRDQRQAWADERVPLLHGAAFGAATLARTEPAGDRAWVPELVDVDGDRALLVESREDDDGAVRRRSSPRRARRRSPGRTRRRSRSRSPDRGRRSRPTRRSGSRWPISRAVPRCPRSGCSSTG